MLLPASLLTLIATTSALSINPFANTQQQYLFSNPPPSHSNDFDIPTIHESAVQARRILHLMKTGTLVTSFPDLSQHASNDDEAGSLENRPEAMGNNPIGLMEYIADCEPESGNPTLLAINIATPYKNYIAGSNISLSVRWWPDQTNYYYGANAPDIPTPHTPAALPRFSLHGYLVPIDTITLARRLIPACFLTTHPDSVLWQPGNDISHASEYMRFVVEHVYWFGGFGDRARIGWLPIEEWQSVTKGEIEQCRLPGEKPIEKGSEKEERKEWL